MRLVTIITGVVHLVTFYYCEINPRLKVIVYRWSIKLSYTENCVGFYISTSWEGYEEI